MKITSFLAFTGFFTQILISAFPANSFAESTLSGAEKVRAAVLSTKESVLVFGNSDEVAYQQLTHTLVDEKINSTDLTSFMNQYASDDERSVFNEAIQHGSLGSKQISEILMTVGSSQVKHASNFKVSCGVGLGIGIPLALAGTILIIMSLGQVTKKHKAESDYQSKVQQTSSQYLATSGQMKTELNQYNSLITTSQTQVNELNRKINSGYYSSGEVATFQSQLTQLNTDLATYKSDLGNLQVSITYTETEYDKSMRKYSDAESKDLASLSRNITAESTAGVVSALVGIPLIFAGASNCQ